MHADDSPQLLEDTGECLFDLSLAGPHLRPVFFRSQSNQTFEEYYDSFVGEVSCGRWAIFCSRKYLWERNSTKSAIVSQLRKY